MAFVQNNDGLRLSPFYDLLSTSIYKEITPKFSYNIGGIYLWRKIQNKHLVNLAKEIGISEVTIKNPANKLFKEIDKYLTTTIQEFESRFVGIKTARTIEKEIKKRMRYFRDKFSLD